MKAKYVLSLALSSCSLAAAAQDDVYPAKAQTGAIALTHATVHVGNGEVIEDGMILFGNGKIIDVRKTAPIADVRVIDCKGKHLYPGLILSTSQLGLVEVPSVKATVDHTELGEMNPNVQSIVAYNSDSKVINTLKSNGITYANLVPQGGLISGTSSVVQLDAWNWEDAVYKRNGGMHLNLPVLMNRPNPFAEFLGLPQSSNADATKRGLEQIEKVKQFFREAKAYVGQSKPTEVNLKLEATRNLFDRKQKLFVHCDLAKEMLIAVDFVKEFNFDVVIVGGSDSYLIAPLLKQHNIPVVLSQCHSLPTLADDGLDQPYKTPYQLQQAGVLFAINDEDGQTRGRNLAFNAGTAVAYGLTKEQALSAITLNAAKILGIADKTGSLEKGKDATIVVAEGDILDMKSSLVTHVFIEGREVNLTDKHKQLYERYKLKYNLQ